MTEHEKDIRQTHELAYGLGYGLGLAHGQQMAFTGVQHLRGVLADRGFNGESVDTAALVAEIAQLKAKPADLDGALDTIAKLQAEVKTLTDRLTAASSRIAELEAQAAATQADLDAANAKLAAIPDPVKGEPVAVQREAGNYPPLPASMKVPEGYELLPCGNTTKEGDKFYDVVSGNWYMTHHIGLVIHKNTKPYCRRIATTGPIIHATEGPTNA